MFFLVFESFGNKRFPFMNCSSASMRLHKSSLSPFPLFLRVFWIPLLCFSFLALFQNLNLKLGNEILILTVFFFTHHRPFLWLFKSLLFSQLEFVKESQIQFQNSVSLAILFSFSPRFCEWLVVCFFSISMSSFLGSSQEETLAEPTRKQYKSFSEEFDA